MNWKKITKILMAVTVAIWIIWDVFAIAGGGTEASISHTFIVWSYKYPFLTYSFGVVCGHLVWRVRRTKELMETIPVKIKKEK
jgi:hypothetical protein